MSNVNDALDFVVGEVCREFGVPIPALYYSRAPSAIMARAAISHVATQEMMISFRQLAKILGKRHPSISYYKMKHEQLQDSDHRYAATVARVAQVVKTRWGQ